MTTAGLLVQTLCVPCACRCRYCLLSWDGKAIGADYERSKRYAEGFRTYIHENDPDIAFDFFIGYSMEHPFLIQALEDFKRNDSVNGTFLQMGGLKMRADAEIETYLVGLKEHGVKRLGFTFYGTREYHDAFAGRKGDFDYLTKLLESAAQMGFETEAGMPLTHENAHMAEEVMRMLTDMDLGRIYAFVPHGEGRGANLEPIRLRKGDYESLSPFVKERFNRALYCTEGEWVQGEVSPEEEKRLLILSLTKENMDFFEGMEYGSAFRYLENLDDTYYGAIPSFAEMLHLYGNADGECFYRKRDLFHAYQKRYIAENKLTVTDVTDERYCGSRRY